MNNTLFYNYLHDVMRLANILTMNTPLCDCQLFFYKILNIFIYFTIMHIIKIVLLLIN